MKKTNIILQKNDQEKERESKIKLQADEINDISTKNKLQEIKIKELDENFAIKKRREHQSAE